MNRKSSKKPYLWIWICVGLGWASVSCQQEVADEGPTAEEIAAKLGQLEEAGLDEIMMLPAPGLQVKVGQEFADQVLPLLAA